jgi:hypothetical protein
VTVVPEVPLGTAKVQLNAPVRLVVKEPLVQLAIDWESKMSEVRGVETEKPVPETVMRLPTVPWAGLTEIIGVVTVKFWGRVRRFAVTSVPTTG